MRELTVLQQLKYIGVAMDLLQSKLDQIALEIADLEGQEMFFARTWYKNGKYLYLVFPMEDGERRREYIGCDEAKIAEAKEKIYRWRRHQDLTDQYRTLSMKYNKLESDVWFMTSTLRNLVGDNVQLSWPEF